MTGPPIYRAHQEANRPSHARGQIHSSAVDREPVRNGPDPRVPCSYATAVFDWMHDLRNSADAGSCRRCINTVLEDQRPRCRGVGPSEQPQQIHVGGTLWKPPSSSCEFEFADRPAHLEPNSHDSCLLDHALQR